MGRLQHTDFLRTLSGQVFLTHYQAVAALSPEVVPGTGEKEGLSAFPAQGDRTFRIAELPPHHVRGRLP